MPRILFIFGTRPEAIKLAPLIRHMRFHPDEFDARVCVTAQHRDMLDQVLDAFQIEPDHDLDVMLPRQSLFQSTSRIIAGLETVLLEERPDLVIVQGDTTTTFCGALAASYQQTPVGHVEAGLRTGDLRQPFPEELNRILTTRLASLHFAPTSSSAENLRAEGVPEAAIAVTGNTGIDAVLHIVEELRSGRLQGREWPQLDAAKRLILVTAHRRESFGQGFEAICRAIARIADRADVQVIYPVHPNPNVQKPVVEYLGGHRNVILTDPLDYVSFVDLMQRADILLTDSGGIQEEGPSLGKPILVMREKTERPEAVLAGTAKLVGADFERIVEEASALLEDRELYASIARKHNPYGDGAASKRIADRILEYLE